jgi:hypothetical protein
MLGLLKKSPEIQGFFELLYANSFRKILFHPGGFRTGVRKDIGLEPLN